MKKVVTVAVVTAISLVGLLGNAWAAGQVHKTFDLPAELTVTLQASACNTAPGPQISVQGDLVLAGLNTEVIFARPGKPVENEPIVVEQVVVPDGSHTSTPGQNVTGGLSNNPYIWVQLLDDKGRALTSEMFLGRCDQGSFTAVAQFRAPAEAIADVSATDCSSQSGPIVMLDGATSIAPLTAKVIFRSSLPTNPPGGRIDQSESQIAIQPSAISYPFSNQPVSAHGGSNPLVSLQFRMDDGSPVSSEVRLGRCSSLIVQ